MCIIIMYGERSGIEVDICVGVSRFGSQVCEICERKLHRMMDSYILCIYVQLWAG